MELSPIALVFTSYSTLLDDKNDRHDRLVKVSRDITSASKKIIFGLHRPYSSESELQKALSTAETNLIPIKKNILKIRDELLGKHYHQYNRAFLWGLQEYCEAVAFLEFFISGELLSKENVEAQIMDADPAWKELTDEGEKKKKRFELSWDDYVLGITDVTGELMRLAISSVGEGKYEFANKITQFVQRIYNGLTNIPEEKLGTRDYQGKLKIMKGSLEKVENLCFKLKLREAEYGEMGGVLNLGDME